LNYSEYLTQPEGDYNLIEGHLYTMAPPTARHQEVLKGLHRRLHDHVAPRRLGWVFPAPLDVVLTETDVIRPDVLFVARAARPGISELAVHRCPELVVEVLSPSTLHVDGLKFALYERHGAQECWKVDPDTGSVEVFGRAEGLWRRLRQWASWETLTSPLLPGLRVPLEGL